MSKSRRGKGIRKEYARGRGTCPRCKIENIKVLYEQEIDGEKVKLCKFCNAFVKNNPPPKPEAPAEPVAEATEAPVEAAAEAEAPAETTEA